MKKTLALVVLTGLMLTGCATKQASSQTPATAAASAVAGLTVEVPDVVGLTLDKATDQLKDLGLKVEAKDVNDDKSIIVKKNWQVVSEDPVGKTKVAEGSTIKLGVKHLTDETATPTPTPTPTQAPVPLVAPVAPEVQAPPVAPVAPPAPPVVEAQPAPVAPVAPPVVEAPPVVAPPAPPAAVYYANCAAVRAAGAAPIHISHPGYGSHLDGDGDGWGCDK
ncbi:excalibur calcium-binding domain-containing protein [Paenarthrobacter nitroguajacolicus]|uniref:excalibur calcium-binding domain-containing protein n=1 Tax=Paenarthrobacter nitroguajacolicus TaxID=211146 RepID=UPI003AE7CF50